MFIIKLREFPGFIPLGGLVSLVLKKPGIRETEPWKAALFRRRKV